MTASVMCQVKVGLDNMVKEILVHSWSSLQLVITCSGFI